MSVYPPGYIRPDECGSQFLLKVSVDVHYLNLSKFFLIDHYYSLLHSQ